MTESLKLLTDIETVICMLVGIGIEMRSSALWLYRNAVI